MELFSNDVILRVINHFQNRYSTVGDYRQLENGNWLITSSDMKNDDYNFLVLIHELLEMYYTQREGIQEIDILKHDMMFERERSEGLHSSEDEPGDDERAPYRKHHAFAEKIEREVAKELGVNWEEYSKVVEELPAIKADEYNWNGGKAE